MHTVSFSGMPFASDVSLFVKKQVVLRKKKHKQQQQKHLLVLRFVCCKSQFVTESVKIRGCWIIPSFQPHHIWTNLNIDCFNRPFLTLMLLSYVEKKEQLQWKKLENWVIKIIVKKNLYLSFFQ